MQSLTEACLSALQVELAGIGWTRPSRRRDLFVSPHAGNLNWQLAANGAGDDIRGVYFLPALGVRHEATVALESEFMGRQPNTDRFLAVYGRGLMDLLPDELWTSDRWYVFREERIGRVMATIADDFRLYGMPFFEDTGDVDSLIAKFYERKRSQDQEGKLAILCALSGRADEALAALNHYIEIANSAHPLFPRAVSRRFVNAFIEHFNIGKNFLAKLSEN